MFYIWNALISTNSFIIHLNPFMPTGAFNIYNKWVTLWESITKNKSIKSFCHRHLINQPSKACVNTLSVQGLSKLYFINNWIFLNIMGSSYIEFKLVLVLNKFYYNRFIYILYIYHSIIPMHDGVYWAKVYRLQSKKKWNRRRRAIFFQVRIV